eukprot:11116777-Ditylum_brightwellii.AAC.1
MVDFCQQFLLELSATNTQFVKQGVEKAGYVMVGYRNETTKSILSTDQDKTIPEAMSKDMEDILGRETPRISGNSSLKTVSYLQRRDTMRSKMLDKDRQFKRKRIANKFNKLLNDVQNNPVPNACKRRVGVILTPLVEGKVQIGKLKQDINKQAIRHNLKSRGVIYTETTNWCTLSKLLKEGEKNCNAEGYDEHFFMPLTSYDNFRWLSSHFEQ